MKAIETAVEATAMGMLIGFAALAMGGSLAAAAIVTAISAMFFSGLRSLSETY